MAIPQITAAIFGCSGCVLSAEEKAFFRDVQPLGFILFSRNIQNPDQLKKLTADLRLCVNHDTPPILVDQEGGRVQRLSPPHWPSHRPVADFFKLYRFAPQKAVEAVTFNFLAIAHYLRELGISVNCAPVLDIPQPGSHDVIGDRACGDDVDSVIALGRSIADALFWGGVLPVIKHIPGHGRATQDSHLGLPHVDTDAEILQKTDFLPFKFLKDVPLAMTAHIVYSAFDKDWPATHSAKVIKSVIRDDMGYKGLLISDDLSMKALGGCFRERAHRSITAGCDVLLHCNGYMEEMHEVAQGSGQISQQAWERWQKALSEKKSRAIMNVDVTDALMWVEELLASDNNS